MATVLFTLQNGFGAVFVREVTLCYVCEETDGLVEKVRLGEPELVFDIMGELCLAEHCGNPESARVNYSPRPGTADAVGCWSRVEDLGR